MLVSRSSCAPSAPFTVIQLCMVPFVMDSSSLAPTAYLPDHVPHEDRDHSVFLDHGILLNTRSAVRVNNTKVLLSRIGTTY